MANLIYSIERETVDPVFFAVVPDSFMTRELGQRPTLRSNNVKGNGSDDMFDQPILSPHDRWSF